MRSGPSAEEEEEEEEEEEDEDEEEEEEEEEEEDAASGEHGRRDATMISARGHYEPSGLLNC